MARNDNFTALGATDPSLIGGPCPTLCFSKTDQKRMTRRIKRLEAQVRSKVKITKIKRIRHEKNTLEDRR